MFAYLWPKRMAAILYDSLIILSILLFVCFVAVLCNKGQAINQHNHYFKIILAIIVYAYYILYWWKSGQTLGLCAWQLQLNSNQQIGLNFKLANLRFLLSCLSLLCLGLGHWWALFDKKQQTLFDRILKIELRPKF